MSKSMSVASTYKINTDGGDIRVRVCLIGELKQQARFANAGFTDKKELEEVVKSVKQRQYARCVALSKSFKRG